VAEKVRVPQAVRSAKMQELLSEVAYEIIRDVGYVDFRTSAVSKKAGVSQGAQLHHYPTKNSLAIAALDYAYIKAQERFEENYALRDEYDDLLDLILKDFMDFYLSDYFSVALDIIMSGGKNEELRSKVIALSRTSRLKVERLWLEELVDDGWPLQLAEDVLALSHSVVRGFAARALVLNDRSEFERLLRQWHSMALALKPVRS
jgi:AcrR family transcriptional regulator